METMAMPLLLLGPLLLAMLLGMAATSNQAPFTKGRGLPAPSAYHVFTCRARNKQWPPRQAPTSTANFCAFSTWRDVRCRRFSISARLRLNESASSFTCGGAGEEDRVMLPGEWCCRG